MNKQLARSPETQASLTTEGRNWPWDAPPDVPVTHYLDNRIYTDVDVYDLEQRNIFRRSWKFVCHESEVARPGDFRLATVAGLPLVILRGQDGIVRSFFNVCPHRGATLIREPHGTLADHRIQCFYHHWTFSSHGACSAIPLPDGYTGSTVCRENISLRAVSTESAYGLVFVDVDGDAGRLEPFLGSALDELAAPLAGLEVFHYHRVEIKANWKLFVETNCEGYHELLHLLNRTTALSQPEYAKRKWNAHPHGHHTFAPAQIAYGRLRLGDRDVGTLPGMDPNGHVVADLFPDVMVNVRATVVRIDSLIPLSPGLTVLECRGLAPAADIADMREQRTRQHNQVWGPLGRNLPEDIWAVETQWANMASGASRFSIVAREQNQQATDDSPIRNFYAEWQRLVGIAPHDIKLPYGTESSRHANG